MLGWVAPPANEEVGQGLLYGDVFGRALVNSHYSAIAASILVFFQSLLLNRLVDSFRMMNDRNWVPGALYALVVSCLPDFLFLSPPLVAVTFVPLALGRVFSVYKQSSAFGAVFDSAFWLSLGCLFHPPLVWLLPVCFAGFFSLRSFNLREQIVFFIAVFVPFLLAFTYYFWFDRVSDFISGQFSRGLEFSVYSFSGATAGALRTGFLAVLLLTVLLGFNVYYYKRLIQIQKYITILYWFLFAGLAAVLLHGHTHLTYFIPLMPSIAIFLAYSFQSLRNTLMAEVFHFGLLAAVFFIQFFPTGS